MPDLSKLSKLLDVPLKLIVSIDTSSMKIHQLLDLKPGSIVDCVANLGDRFDVSLNDVVIGQGEITVSEGRLAVRLVRLSEES